MMMTLQNHMRQQPGVALMTLQSAMRPQHGQSMFLLDSVKLESVEQFGHSLSRVEDFPSTSSTGVYEGVDVDEEMFLARAHQEYKAGNYKYALQNCLMVYNKSPQRTDALLLLGAIYYQLHDFDMCLVKNEEAIRIEPKFAECYGNMANALKEKGDIDLAILYYSAAIELKPNFCDAWSNLASAFMRKGRLQEAAECCQHALILNPRLVDAHSNLGNLLKAQGLTHHAYLCYVEAIRLQPTFAIAWSNLAGLLMEAGELQKALTYYKEAIRLKPSFVDAHLNLGNVLKAMNRHQEAIACYNRSIQLRPDYAIAYGNLASVYYEQGLLDHAIVHYKQALLFDSSFIEAYNNLGNALKDAGQVDGAISCYEKCLQLQDSHPQALTNLGNIYMECNMVSTAATFYKATLNVTTGLSAPYSNLATIYKQQGNYADAIACYNEVMRVDPMAADGLVNRGNTLKEIGRVSEAIQDYIRAVAIRPTMAEAHANLASAYKDSGHVEAAIKSYKQALFLRPDFPEVTCNLLHTLQCVCDWDDRDKKFTEVEAVIRRQIKMRLLPSVQPFHAIAYPIDPILALEISRKYAEHCSLIATRYGVQSFTPPIAIPVKNEGGSGRLRVGYVSSDFGNHPLSHLMGSIFGMHNRNHVEVFCYALSPSDGSEWRQRISAEAEHFIDVSAMASDAIAELINNNKIQILVNLNGYTKGARNEIFAMRPAPIQVSYMGFPGTTGADYIDYLVTDELVSPHEYAHIYSEKIVHLPHCYFVNDYKQRNRDVLDPSISMKRSDYSLPEDKFLFACFNQLYKMDPEIFSTWCRILKRVPNSALWLLRFPAAGETRLKAFAIAQGVRPEQFIFTDVAAKNEHIRRSALADLFLDSPLCNAHTTGTDVLWAGLPMVTLPLEKMATRVAMSLCYAAGFGEEMVVSSMQEYEERAVMLATNPAILKALTANLRASRLSSPLFDTIRWVRNFERSFFKMWNLNSELQLGLTKHSANRLRSRVTELVSEEGNFFVGKRGARRMGSTPRRLEGKVAVITASTQGIGFGIAERLGLEGASVVISSRKQKNVDEAVMKLKSKGIEAMGLECHVSLADHRKRLMESTVEKYGHIDIVVSNAAANPSIDPIVSMSEKALDKLWEVNLKASVQVVQAAAPHLSENSSVMFISSIAAYDPTSSLAMYGVMKTALLGLTKALAEELAPRTRVNAIAPGFVPTHFADFLVRNEEARTEIESRTLLRRLGTVGDMAATAAFLASDDSSYITGETIVVAGGMKSRL